MQQEDGINLFNQKKYKEALDAFEKADPGDDLANFYKGVIYCYGESDVKNPELSLNCLLKINGPLEGQAAFIAGHQLSLLGRRREAALQYERAYKLGEVNSGYRLYILAKNGYYNMEKKDAFNALTRAENCGHLMAKRELLVLDIKLNRGVLKFIKAIFLTPKLLVDLAKASKNGDLDEKIKINF